MKLLYNIGAVVSLVLVACGIVFAWKSIMFDGSVTTCIWCFASALALSLVIYVFNLSNRIAVLEKANEHPD